MGRLQINETKKKKSSKDLKISGATIFEDKPGVWREIKPGNTWNQEYLRRKQNGIPVKTATGTVAEKNKKSKKG
tara:strand:- start:27 stop:248 length:222 start_codon:yes stop_codon:yes gene_type:complete